MIISFTVKVHINLLIVHDLPRGRKKDAPPDSERSRTNIGSMLGQCRKRWANIDPVMGQRYFCLEMRRI